MKNKQFIGVALLVVGAVGLGAGAGSSYAKFTTDIAAEIKDDAIKSARFDIGSSLGDKTKNVQVSASHFYPGAGMQVLNFEVDKTNSDVEVGYEIEILPHGELFAEGTPVTYNLYELDVENNKVVKNLAYKKPFTGTLNTGEIIPTSDKSTYAIDIEWPKNGDDSKDTEFAGKVGSFDITVTANQIMK